MTYAQAFRIICRYEVYGEGGLLEYTEALNVRENFRKSFTNPAKAGGGKRF